MFSVSTRQVLRPREDISHLALTMLSILPAAHLTASALPLTLSRLNHLAVLFRLVESLAYAYPLCYHFGAKVSVPAAVYTLPGRSASC